MGVRRGYRCIILAFFTPVLFILPALSTNIATFTDAKCKESHENISGPNGYPNGTCTVLDVQGSFGSFQVVDEDPGCSVTIYGKDSDPESPCSSTVLEFASLARCYNTSWVYYSIDACTPPDQLPSSSSASSSSKPSSSNATTPTSSPSPEPQRKSRTGAIVGGVVGGVSGIALVAGLVFFSVRRNRRLRQDQRTAQQEVAGTPLTELPPKDEKYEIYTHKDEPHEMGRNSVYAPPAELQGDGIKPGTPDKELGAAPSDVTGGAKS
ncbi:hypothetical protein K458DRAFT_309108 [Lentithecium fluviatile CBS 122367]|uniref:Mid2 domain-containing protein n=1 Tax=Lentithecium fluviatile CBS 122367 TaxID=1168545 RepID=A0A6G1IUP6_9PLEO|nr:hypothetical protein K458DRAFT_309108 [Lentithecium fluviatile CBS 122367]